jgi:FkbM family methyltransferase
MKKNTQTGFLKIIENLILIHPLFYFICRKFAQYFSIYESDTCHLKNFIKKRINIIDIGASDGISAKYFVKNFKVDKIYCYEPNQIYSKNLDDLKKKFLKKIILRKFGISYKHEKVYVYIPYYRFLNKIYYLSSWAFYSLDLLKKNIKFVFFFYKSIKIIKKQIRLKKFSLIKKKINLIKIDTNGYEYEIIKSLKKQILRDRPFIIIENNYQKYKIIKNLKKYDYLLKNMSQTNTLNLFFIPQ